MEKRKKSKCSYCNSSNIYVLRSGEIVCRACGSVTKDSFQQELMDHKTKEGEV